MTSTCLITVKFLMCDIDDIVVVLKRGSLFFRDRNRYS